SGEQPDAQTVAQLPQLDEATLMRMYQAMQAAALPMPPAVAAAALQQTWSAAPPPPPPPFFLPGSGVHGAAQPSRAPARAAQGNAPSASQHGAAHPRSGQPVASAHPFSDTGASAPAARRAHGPAPSLVHRGTSG
ncbi:hypothetical protein AURDEDRAFT_166640, partial [Auricularia subglabra TFB-10046 SS5]